MTRRLRRGRDSQRARIVVVCEAAADQRTACTVADRVLCERSSWLEAETLDAVREWSGVDPGSNFVSWPGVKREADARGIRAHGLFAGKPGALDARAARRALLLIESRDEKAAGVLLVRDSDNRPERLVGLNQARECAKWSFAVAIGVAHPKLESWLLAAFRAADKADQSHLAALRKELGRDPCTNSHELTAGGDSAKKSAKRVLAALCGNDAEKAEHGLDCTPLDTLRERGQRNGLSDYMSEVETRLLPLFE